MFQVSNLSYLRIHVSEFIEYLCFMSLWYLLVCVPGVRSLKSLQAFIPRLSVRFWGPVSRV